MHQKMDGFRHGAATSLCIFLTIFWCISKMSSAQNVSPENTLVFGPGLKADFVMPVRYFFIQAVDTNGNKWVVTFQMEGDTVRRNWHDWYSTVNYVKLTLPLVFKFTRSWIMGRSPRFKWVRDLPFIIVTGTWSKLHELSAPARELPQCRSRVWSR